MVWVYDFRWNKSNIRELKTNTHAIIRSRWKTAHNICACIKCLRVCHKMFLLSILDCLFLVYFFPHLFCCSYFRFVLRWFFQFDCCCLIWLFLFHSLSITLSFTLADFRCCDDSIEYAWKQIEIYVLD